MPLTELEARSFSILDSSLDTNQSVSDLLTKLNSPSHNEVTEWLQVAQNNPESQLDKLNNHLKSSVFVVQNQLTVADISLFFSLSSTIQSLPAEGRLAHNHLVRWFDNIQHLDQLKNKTEIITIKTSVEEVRKEIEEQNKTKQKDEAAAPKPKAKKEAKAEAKPEVVAVNPTQEPPKEPTKETPKEETPNEKSPKEETPKEETPKEETPKEAPKEKPKREKQQKAPKEKQEKPKAQKGKAAKDEGEQRDPVTHLEIKVGKILSVKKHENADSLYVEQIDLGEESGPRTIVSGLVEFVPLEQMENRIVVVLCNLKPKNARGILSNGMVLCATFTDPDGKKIVEPLIVPSGVPVGERIQFPPHSGEPDLPHINPKKKIFETVQPLLRTKEDKTAYYGDIPFTTSAGPITVSHSAGGTIS